MLKTDVFSRAFASLGKVASVAGYLALFAIFFAIWVPVRPSFPAGTQLDNSWIIGLHEAAGLGLSMGQDIVFTFGPYAAVYTGEYHPATDALMLFGGALLAVAFFAIFTALSSFRGRALALVVGLMLLAIFRQKDALLFSYPLLVTVFVFLRYMSPSNASSNALSDTQASKAFLALLLVPFGLLPLIKGSALMTVGATSLLCLVALVIMKRRTEATLFIVVPPVSCALLWLISGQSLLDFLPFFFNLAPIVSGYTPAMSSVGPAAEWVVYLGGCTLVALSIISAKDVRLWSRMFLLTGFALMLFLAFKAGFVRHDGHAIIAGAALGIVGGFLLLLPVRMKAVVVASCVFVWAYLDSRYTKTSTESLVGAAVGPFVSLKNGFAIRFGREAGSSLDSMAKGQREVLAKECPIDKLDGSVDIYSYRQACLIFSGNAWSPRPVFQSYSAYTPRLAYMNADHLLGTRAPDNILFRIEPIDLRLPSLEDGPSWPIILQLYSPAKLDGDLAYLKKRPNAPQLERTNFDAKLSAEIAASVVVPSHESVMMARVTLSPSLVGRVANVLFKAPAPSIVLTLQNGAERRFRFVPGMASAEFVISPHIASTRDFILLMEGRREALAASRVTSFRVEVGSGGSWFWSNSVDVSFSPLTVQPSGTQLTQRLFDRRLDVPPAAGKPSATLVCEGSIDRLNGVTPVPMAMSSGPVIGLDGWTAVSTKTGVLPDEVYVVVRSSAGNSSYFRARSAPRPDVRDHFRQAGLLNAGFEAYIDVSGMGDEVTLHLAQVTQGRLTFCEPFRRVTVSN